MNDQKALLSREEWALYNVIVYNEISVFPDRDGNSSSPYATPYQLLDVIYGNSALSWGAKQIDLWGNLGEDAWPHRAWIAQTAPAAPGLLS